MALLSDKKASQASDIPVKIIKENRGLIAYFILHNFNNSLSCSEYTASLKYADITPILKNGVNFMTQWVMQVHFSLTSLKHLIA